MERAARFLIHRWSLLVGALVIIASLAMWRTLLLEFDFSFHRFFLPEAEDSLAADLRERFGNNAGAYLVAILQTEDVFDSKLLTAVQEMSDEITAIPHVRQVFSLATAPYIHGRNDELSLEPIASLATKGTSLPELRAQVLSSPLFSRRLVSPDGRETVVLALVDPTHRTIGERAPTIAAFRNVVEARLPPRTTALFTGYPITEAEYARTVLLGFGVAQAVGLTLMGITLYLTFRTIPAVMLTLCTVGIATVLVMGIIQVTGQRLTFTNASVPLMMLVIGVSEVSFFVSRFYEEAIAGWDEWTPIRAATSALWPGLVAACTTSAGFIALAAGHIGLTRDFGFNMGIAGLVTFLVAAILIPGALKRCGRPPERAIRAIKAGGVTRWIARTTTWALRRPWIIVAGSIGFAIFGCVGIRRVTLDQYATRELSPGHTILRAQAVVDSDLGGAFQTHVVIHRPDGGSIATPAHLQAMESLQRFLADQPDVVKTWSVVDYLKELNMAIRGGKPEERCLPESASLLAQYLLLLSSGSTTSDFPTLIDPTQRYASIVLGTTDLGTDKLRALRRRTDTFVHDQLASLFELHFVGDYWEIARGNEILAWDQVVSTLGSFVLILPFVALFLRSWKLTLLCLPPNILPLLASLGLMGFAHIDLRTGTSIILPVTVGVTIDATTHFLSRAREEWRLDGDYPAAVRRALVGTGWGITSSTLALVVGFLAYQVPPFRTFKDVGILASWTMLVALPVNLLLTPLLVLCARPFGQRDIPLTGQPGHARAERLNAL